MRLLRKVTFLVQERKLPSTWITTPSWSKRGTGKLQNVHIFVRNSEQTNIIKYVCLVDRGMDLSSHTGCAKNKERLHVVATTKPCQARSYLVQQHRYLRATAYLYITYDLACRFGVSGYDMYGAVHLCTVV